MEQQEAFKQSVKTESILNSIEKRQCPVCGSELKSQTDSPDDVLCRDCFVSVDAATKGDIDHVIYLKNNAEKLGMDVEEFRKMNDTEGLTIRDIKKKIGYQEPEEEEDRPSWQKAA